MSKARQHKTREELEYLTKRFEHMSFITKGRSNVLSSPFKGKNRAQKQRLGAAFQAMKKKVPQFNFSNDRNIPRQPRTR